MWDWVRFANTVFFLSKGLQVQQRIEGAVIITLEPGLVAGEQGEGVGVFGQGGESGGQTVDTVKLSRSLVQRLHHYARTTELTLSEIVSRALMTVLPRGRGRG